MRESRHTKGPWFVTRKFEVGPRSYADDQANGMVIPLADVFGDNKEADASLIATAPDLLEAAKRFFILEVETCDCDVCAAWASDLKAVIAKAEGRP